MVALLVGLSGRLTALRPPAPQAVLLGLTGLVLVLTATIPTLRTWALTVDLRVLVGLHVTRFVGFYFLFLYRRGELPFAFAVPGGWGDVTVATLAAALLVTGPAVGVGRRRAYLVWNVIGLIDILFVVATATRLGLADPQALQPLLRLPLSLLPTFLVPLIIASHLLLAKRLLTSEPGARRDAA